jgi:hypothetical protein
MDTKISIIVSIILFSLLAVSCSSGGKMVQAKDKTPGGLPLMKPQVDTNLQTVAHLPDEIKFPDMAPFDETAQYEFKSGKSIDEVAKWFETTLGSSNKRIELNDGHMWKINTGKGYDVELYIYEGGTHLKYQKQIN